MDDDKKVTPAYALDLIMEQYNAEKKRLWIALLIVFIALVGSNMAWVVYENSFVDTIEIEQKAPNGNNNYVGHDGDIANGISKDN